MIVKTPSLWHALATQISTAQTPRLLAFCAVLITGVFPGKAFQANFRPVLYKISDSLSTCCYWQVPCF